MKVKFTTSARLELIEAIEYYNSQRVGLGYEFAIEIDSGVNKIVRFPDAWMRISSRLRRCMIKRFPYGIIYSVNDNTVIIVSIMNLHKKPKG